MKDSMVISWDGGYMLYTCIGEECIVDASKAQPIYSGIRDAQKHGWHRTRGLNWTCPTCGGTKTQREKRFNEAKLTRSQQHTYVIKRNTRLIAEWTNPKIIFGDPS